MTLTAPAHITGSLKDGIKPNAKALRVVRDDWIAAAVQSGHEAHEIATALGTSRHTASRLVSAARYRLSIAAPVQAPVVLKKAPIGISLHRAPWEVTTDHDPRHETTPRFSLVRVMPEVSRIDAVIETIRAEAGRAQA